MEPQFAIWLTAPATCLTPASFAFCRRDARTTRYEGCRDTTVPVTMIVIQDGADLTLTLETPGPLAVERAQFPQVTVPHVQPFDELLMPSGYGDAILDPLKAIQLYGRRQRRPPPLGLTFVDNTQDEIIYNYPALAGLQYMVLHNAGRSVYVASYATGAHSLAFRARAPGGRQLVLAVEHYPDTVTGRWQTPPCGVAEFGGGWHGASDHYRARMERQWSAPQLPAWMARGEFQGWVQVPMHLEGQPPVCRFGDIPDAMRRALGLGHNLIHLYGWMGNGHDTLYPDYEPDPALGTAAELRRALDEVRRLGGRAILYTNGKLMATDSKFFQAHGRECCVLDAKGEPCRENYGTEAEFHIACPGSRRWREHFAGVVRRMVGEYGAHAVQIDQVASTWLQPCWRRDHDHAGSHDNALPGMEALLREIRDTCRQLDPEFFVWAEGCQERLGQFFDVHQGSYSEGPLTAFSVTVGRKFPEQFRFTWPRALVMGGVSDVSSLCRTFAQGKLFDCNMDAFADPEFAALHGQLLRLRREHPEYFARGTFRDDCGVAVPGPARAYTLQGEHGTLVSIWVPGAGPQQRWQLPVRWAGGAAPPRALYPRDLVATSEEVAFTGPLAVFELNFRLERDNS